MAESQSSRFQSRSRDDLYFVCEKGMRQNSNYWVHESETTVQVYVRNSSVRDNRQGLRCVVPGCAGKASVHVATCMGRLTQQHRFAQCSSEAKKKLKWARVQRAALAAARNEPQRRTEQLVIQAEFKECGDDDCSIIDVTPEKTPSRSPDSGHDEGQFSVSDVDSFDTNDVGPAGLVIVEDQYDEKGDEIHENQRMAKDDERGNSQCAKRRSRDRHAMSSSSTVGGECVEMTLCVDEQEEAGSSASVAVGDEQFIGVDLSWRRFVQSYSAWLHGQRPPAMDMVMPPRPFQPGLAYPPDLVFRPQDAMSKHMYAVMSPEGLQQSLQAACMKSEATLNELNAQVRAQVMAVCRENSLLEHQQQLLQSQQPTPFMAFMHHHHQQQHQGIQNHHQQRSSSENLISWMFPAAAGFDANLAMRSLQNHLPEHQSTLSATRLPKGEPIPSVTTHHTGFSDTNPWFGTVAAGNSWHQPTMASWPYNGAPMPALPQQQAQPPLTENQQQYCCANSCVEQARFACQCPGAVYCSLDCQQSDWDARHSKTCTFKQN